MPNSLAHFAVQGIASRAAFQSVPTHWILLGAAIPDVPWIIQRIARAFVPGLDPYELRLYAVAQASLAVSVLLCVGLAALADRPGRILGVLLVNCVLHLGLDSLETKWANGVHPFAPFSWEPINFGFFWPDSVAVYSLTAAGILFVWSERRHVTADSPGLNLSGARMRVSLVFIATYIFAPVAFSHAVAAQDNHFVTTLREVEIRTGRQIEFDRVRFSDQGDTGFLFTYAGEPVRVVGNVPDNAGTISARGVFVGSTTVQVQEVHQHPRGSRDLPTYVGLAALALFWVAALRRQPPGFGNAISPCGRHLPPLHRRTGAEQHGSAKVR